jgi:hypothetical protein
MQSGHGPKARAAVMAGSRFGARCPGQPRISDTVRVPRMPAMRTMAGMARTRARRDEQPPDQDQLVLRRILGDTGFDRADLRRAAVLNYELYGFYGISVWVTSARASPGAAGVHQADQVRALRRVHGRRPHRARAGAAGPPGSARTTMSSAEGMTWNP